MTLNMILLAFSPEIAGLPAQPAKFAPLHRLYDFIVETQNRRAKREVARYLRRIGRARA